MFDLSSVLKLLPAVGPAVAALPEFVAVYNQVVSTFGEKDQAVLKDAYADLIAENDEGHHRLQEKLRRAASG